MYYIMEELQSLSGTNSKDQHFNREESLIAEGVCRGRSGNRKPSHPVPLPGQCRVWRGSVCQSFVKKSQLSFPQSLVTFQGMCQRKVGGGGEVILRKIALSCAGSFIFILFLKSQIILQDLEDKKRFLCPNPHRPQTHDLESWHQGDPVFVNVPCTPTHTHTHTHSISLTPIHPSAILILPPKPPLNSSTGPQLRHPGVASFLNVTLPCPPPAPHFEVFQAQQADWSFKL